MENRSIAHSLSFLREHTGEDELTLLSRALDPGLNELYRQTVEQAFVDGEMARDEVVLILGLDRVQDLEYAMGALAQDVERGLGL